MKNMENIVKITKFHRKLVKNSLTMGLRPIYGTFYLNHGENFHTTPFAAAICMIWRNKLFYENYIFKLENRKTIWMKKVENIVRITNFNRELVKNFHWPWVYSLFMENFCQKHGEYFFNSTGTPFASKIWRNKLIYEKCLFKLGNRNNFE